VTPVDDSLVVSPADGRVCFIGHRAPPPELGLGDKPMRMVGIFMNVFDVHVNRAPVSGPSPRRLQGGRVFQRRSGQGERKERAQRLCVFDAVTAPLAAVQIAGLVARRILSWSVEGDSVTAGERIGMIRFGSRVDVYLPEGAVVDVAMDQRTLAGETVIARFGQAPTGERFHRTS
jgi:phosphatidylserine decarboxylase